MASPGSSGTGSVTELATKPDATEHSKHDRHDMVEPRRRAYALRTGRSRSAKIWVVRSSSSASGRGCRPAGTAGPARRTLRAEAVERQHLDALDGRQAGDEVGQRVDVGRVVGQAGHQHESDPDRDAPLGEPVREAHGRRQATGAG